MSPKDFSYLELVMLKHAIETVYRQERGEPEKAPFAGSFFEMSSEEWETICDLRRRLQKLTP